MKIPTTEKDLEGVDVSDDEAAEFESLMLRMNDALSSAGIPYTLDWALSIALMSAHFWYGAGGPRIAKAFANLAEAAYRDTVDHQPGGYFPPGCTLEELRAVLVDPRERLIRLARIVQGVKVDDSLAGASALLATAAMMARRMRFPESAWVDFARAAFEDVEQRYKARGRT